MLFRKKHIIHQEKLQTLKLDFDKSLLTTKMEIQEQTFLNISREIHDNINLSLTLVKLNLNTIDVSSPSKIELALQSSKEILSNTISNLSNLSKSMSPDVIKNGGLLQALKIEMDRIQQVAQIPIHYNIYGETVFLDCEKELVLFRIIQEAFNNVLKHAKAKNIWMDLNYNTKSLQVSIRDDGEGFTVSTAKGEEMKAGLSNMKNRAELFGGEFLLLSQPGTGTQIFVTIPY